jgi:hypothetical protein
VGTHVPDGRKRLGSAAHLRQDTVEIETSCQTISKKEHEAFDYFLQQTRGRHVAKRGGL